MMDSSIKKDCDQMIVEAIRMARENKDRAYLFTGAWEEIENRFGLDHTTVSGLATLLKNQKLSDGVTVFDAVLKIIYGAALEEEGDTQERRRYRNKLEQRMERHRRRARELNHFPPPPSE